MFPSNSSIPTQSPQWRPSVSAGGGPSSNQTLSQNQNTGESVDYLIRGADTVQFSADANSLMISCPDPSNLTQSQQNEEAERNVGSQVGTVAGAAAGATAGAQVGIGIGAVLGGPIGAIAGGAIGGIAGGIGGAIAGSSLGRWLAS